jgi:hypothetical protein
MAIDNQTIWNGELLTSKRATPLSRQPGKCRKTRSQLVVTDRKPAELLNRAPQPLNQMTMQVLMSINRLAVYDLITMGVVSIDCVFREQWYFRPSQSSQLGD